MTRELYLVYTEVSCSAQTIVTRPSLLRTSTLVSCQPVLTDARREFKAAYLTSAIIGAYVVLWLPYEIGRSLLAAGSAAGRALAVRDVGVVLGMFNSSFNWILYAAISGSY